MEELKHNITAKAVSAVKWSALIEVVTRTVQPIIFVILARLLTPYDFGIVTTAMIAISFSQTLWDAGLSKALIQTKAAPEEVAHIVFWTNVILGILIYMILFVAAPAIALFFKSPASGPVLRVLGIQIVIASLTSVHQALFVRLLDFRVLFWIKLFTAFVPSLFAIPLALSGYGVWALVAGSLSGQAINCYLLWKKSNWKPRFSYDWVKAPSLYRFGFWVLLESLGAWLILWGDNLIVGRFLGVHDLGVYRTGWMLVTIIFGLALNPFLPVLYPTFSRLQDDLPALKKSFHSINRVVFALALPMGMGLLLVGSESADLFFGDRWQGLGFVLAVLGLTYSISWLVSINTEVYRAMGKPNINTVLMFAHISYYLPCFYIASQFGLETFTLTRLIVAIISIPIQTYFCVKLLNVSPFYIWQEGKPVIIATIGMLIGTIMLKYGLLLLIPKSYAVFSLGALIFAGCLIYLLCLWLLDRDFILCTLTLLKRVST